MAKDIISSFTSVCDKSIIFQLLFQLLQIQLKKIVGDSHPCETYILVMPSCLANILCKIEIQGQDTQAQYVQGQDRSQP